MDKMGNNSPDEYQLCFTHAIHLAAVDVIYKNQDDNKNQNVNVEDDCENFTVKIDIFSDSNEDENGVIEQAPNLHPELHKVLVKVSSCPNSSKDEFGQELVLILVSKAR